MNASSPDDDVDWHWDWAVLSGGCRCWLWRDALLCWCCWLADGVVQYNILQLPGRIPIHSQMCAAQRGEHGLISSLLLCSGPRNAKQDDDLRRWSRRRCRRRRRQRTHARNRFSLSRRYLHHYVKWSNRSLVILLGASSKNSGLDVGKIWLGCHFVHSLLFSWLLLVD